MALQYNLTMDSGVVVNSAYATINQIFTIHNSSTNTHSVNVEVYKDVAAFTAGNPPVTNIGIVRDFDPTASVSFNDLYTWLKTLPEFAGAVDA